VRTGNISRETRETRVRVAVDLDGAGKASIRMPSRFLSHMLTSLATHSMFDIEVDAEGDLAHHVSEDAAICLGQAIKAALGDYRGIARFGYASVPMDDALASAALDLSNRPYTAIDLKTEGYVVEDTPCEDVHHFLASFAQALGATLHLRVEYGQNDHHKAEAAFKALALSLRMAVAPDPKRSGVPSSKESM